MRKILPIFFLTAVVGSINAQSTWEERIYPIFNSGDCNSSSCHGAGASNPSFNVTLPADSFYMSIINDTVVNFHARTETDNRLIYPFFPEKSFMMRKLAHCTSGPLALHLNEGVHMPEDLDALPDSTLELIYAWIKAGAKDTGYLAVDTVQGSICDTTVSAAGALISDISFSIYPNPAKENISISFSIATSSQVKMELIDTKGGVVRTFAEEKIPAGYFKRNFNISGIKGMYIIRITAEGEGAVLKKLVAF